MIIGVQLILVTIKRVFHFPIVFVNNLYDYVFIDLNMDYLKTDDMQLELKNYHSTVLCTAVCIETINHYMNEGSDVYSCRSYRRRQSF